MDEDGGKYFLWYACFYPPVYTALYHIRLVACIFKDSLLSQSIQRIWNFYVLAQTYIKFSQIKLPPQNSSRQKCNVAKFPYWGPTNIRRYPTKLTNLSDLFSGICTLLFHWLLYKPPVFKKYTYCSRSVFMCFVWISE